MCLVVFSPKLNINNVLFTLAFQFILQIVAKVTFARCVSDHITCLLASPTLQGAAPFGSCPSLWSHLSAMLPALSSLCSIADLGSSTLLSNYRPALMLLPGTLSPLSLANAYSSFKFQPKCPLLKKNFLVFQDMSDPLHMCSQSTLPNQSICHSSS